MCCGVVPILFGWFLSVPSLHVLVFLWKTFLDLFVIIIVAKILRNMVFRCGGGQGSPELCMKLG